MIYNKLFCHEEKLDNKSGSKENCCCLINRKGQIGQILTSFPALIYVFVIMLIFIIISGFLAKDFGQENADKDPAEFQYAYEKIEKYFPPKNAGPDSLIEEILQSTLWINNEVSVEKAIKLMCRQQDPSFSREIVAKLLEHFKIYSKGNANKFLAAVPDAYYPSVYYLWVWNPGDFSDYYANPGFYRDPKFPDVPTVNNLVLNATFGGNDVQSKTFPCSAGDFVITFYVKEGVNA